MSQYYNSLSFLSSNTLWIIFFNTSLYPLWWLHPLYRTLAKSFFPSNQLSVTPPKPYRLVISFHVAVLFAMLGESRPFICPNCNKSYKRKDYLTRHLQFECGKQPSFECPHCPFKSKHKHNLRSHIVVKHRKLQ